MQFQYSDVKYVIILVPLKWILDLKFNSYFFLNVTIYFIIYADYNYKAIKLNEEQYKQNKYIVHLTNIILVHKEQDKSIT